MKRLKGRVRPFALLALLLVLVLGAAPARAQVDSVARKAAVPDSLDRGTGFRYDPDAGVQYKNGNFKWTTWAFAERLLGGGTPPAWRRVRQGMEILLPSYPLRFRGQRFRTALIYEVDFTDNNFFIDSKRFKIWENLYVTFQNDQDPTKFRLLFGENTSILSREDNLSSSNLPTINRSLILEQHGSTNSFGTQWGVEAQAQITPRTFVQAALQDNRGSLNQDRPSYQFWNGMTGKVTESLLLPSDKSPQKLNVAGAVDYTRNLVDKTFALSSGLGQSSLGSTPASGNKLTFEHNLDYTNKRGGHFYTLEYEGIYSMYSAQRLHVRGGYAQVQVQLFDGPGTGELVPFVRYDLVSLAHAVGTDLGQSATEEAFRLGLNYNLPHTDKHAGFHLEYARHWLAGSPSILTTSLTHFNELRFELRLNATRYLRF